MLNNLRTSIGTPGVAPVQAIPISTYVPIPQPVWSTLDSMVKKNELAQELQADIESKFPALKEAAIVGTKDQDAVAGIIKNAEEDLGKLGNSPGYAIFGNLRSIAKRIANDPTISRAIKNKQLWDQFVSSTNAEHGYTEQERNAYIEEQREKFNNTPGAVDFAPSKIAKYIDYAQEGQGYVQKEYANNPIKSAPRVIKADPERNEVTTETVTDTHLAKDSVVRGLVTTWKSRPDSINTLETRWKLQQRLDKRNLTFEAFLKEEAERVVSTVNRRSVQRQTDINKEYFQKQEENGLPTSVAGYGQGERSNLSREGILPETKAQIVKLSEMDASLRKERESLEGTGKLTGKNLLVHAPLNTPKGVRNFATGAVLQQSPNSGRYSVFVPATATDDAYVHNSRLAARFQRLEHSAKTLIAQNAAKFGLFANASTDQNPNAQPILLGLDENSVQNMIKGVEEVRNNSSVPFIRKTYSKKPGLGAKIVKYEDLVQRAKDEGVTISSILNRLNPETSPGTNTYSARDIEKVPIYIQYEKSYIPFEDYVKKEDEVLSAAFQEQYRSINAAGEMVDLQPVIRMTEAALLTKAGKPGTDSLPNTSENTAYKNALKSAIATEKGIPSDRVDNIVGAEIMPSGQVLVKYNKKSGTGNDATVEQDTIVIERNSALEHLFFSKAYPVLLEFGLNVHDVQARRALRDDVNLLAKNEQVKSVPINYLLNYYSKNNQNLQLYNKLAEKINNGLSIELVKSNGKFEIVVQDRGENVTIPVYPFRSLDELLVFKYDKNTNTYAHSNLESLIKEILDKTVTS